MNSTRPFGSSTAIRGVSVGQPTGTCFGFAILGLTPPNGPGIELPAARDLTMGQPAAARACRLPMRAAGGWGAPARPGAAAGQLQCLVRRHVPARWRCEVDG